MQKRSLYSLLLTSFILVFAFSYSFAQEVTFESKTVTRGETSVLDVDVNNPADISAFEIVFEVTEGSGGAFFEALDVNWDTNLDVLLHRYIDLSGVDNVTPDYVRIAGMMIDGADACLAAGVTTVAQVEFTTNNTCAGTVILDGTTLQIEKCGGACTIDAHTQFVDCATTALVDAAVTAGTVTIVNTAPSVEAIDDATIMWGTTYTGQIVADDPDLAGGYEDLTYSLISGPGALTVNANTGAISWVTTAPDMIAGCVYPVEVQVEDGCGEVATTSFTIYLMNEAPYYTDCPTDTTSILWGETAMGTVAATDPDGGPAPLLFSMESFDGPGTVTVAPATGAWEWHTAEDPAYVGFFDLCIKVTDGAFIGPMGCNPENSATCCVTIYVLTTGTVKIEKTHDAMMGAEEMVSITMENSVLEMGGFDFLIQYDPSALTFIDAMLADPVDWKWEYFTYRQGPAGNCGASACPTGFLRMVAIAEMNNGENHPDFFKGVDYDVWNLVDLKFLVKNDLTLECMYVPIRWVWYDCGDNGISSVTGDTLFISRYVYEFEGDEISAEDEFPTWFGAPEICNEGDKLFPLRALDFWNGGVDIICADSIDARGDINLNGIDNEVADAVLFSNYFVYGLSVFNVNVDGQVAATDVNADGITLSVADLVYLIRVIVGDASPYLKATAPVDVSYSNHNGLLSVRGDIGAAVVTVEGNATPDLRATEMDLLYHYDAASNVTRLLVYSLEGNSFTGPFVQVEGSVLSVEMATRDGNPVNLNMLPTEFTLNQNYPNPFNPTTNLSFTLPVASDYTLSIYNVSGQRVAEFSGFEQAGEKVITWSADGLASGIYFYQLKTDAFSAVKKMVLLK